MSLSDHPTPTTTAPRRTWPPLRLLLCSLLVTVGVPFHYGYQLTWISPAEGALLRFVNKSVEEHYRQNFGRDVIEALWGVNVALFVAGAIPGAILMQKMVDYFGRKPVIVVSNAAIALCCAADGAAKFLVSIELFGIFRFLLGFWAIVGIGASSVFLTECSPKYCRGAIGMTIGVLIQLGAIVGAILAMPQLWGDEHNWWLIFMVETVAQIVVTCSLLTLHESPSFLLSRGGAMAAAASIEYYHGKQSPGELQSVMDELHLELRSNSNPLGMIAVWRVRKSRVIRRALWVGIVLGGCMSFCGIAVIDAYLVEILHHTMGFSLLHASLAYVTMQILGLMVEILSSFLVDQVGRRPLMFISFILMFGTNLAIAALMYFNTLYQSLLLNIALVIAVFIFCASFCCGLFPLYYFVTTEMVGQNARSTTQGWARLFDCITRFVVLAAYPPMSNLIGTGQAYALFFLPVLGFAGVYLFFAMPETKNRNLMEVAAEVEGLLKAPNIFRKKGRKQNSMNSQKVIA